MLHGKSAPSSEKAAEFIRDIRNLTGIRKCCEHKIIKQVDFGH
jgi:hypothetical protein